MKRIIATRGTGKSTELLRMAIREHGGIATANMDGFRSFVLIAEAIGVDPKEIMVYVDHAVIKGVPVAYFTKWMRTPKDSAFRSCNKLFVDELELCARRMFFQYELAGYSLSLEGDWG